MTRFLSRDAVSGFWIGPFCAYPEFGTRFDILDCGNSCGVHATAI
jgi:hypothetical protein